MVVFCKLFRGKNHLRTFVNIPYLKNQGCVIAVVLEFLGQIGQSKTIDTGNYLHDYYLPL